LTFLKVVVVRELEAKFLTTGPQAPEHVLRRLQETLAWAGFRVQPRGHRTMTDTYFDSPDQQLRKAGWSYRLREDAQGRRIALREISVTRDGIFDREGLEQVLPGPHDDLRHPGLGPVQERLSNLLHPDAGVTPLFTVCNQRDAYQLSHADHPRGLVEMAFDHASVHARDRLDFHELELALKDGPHDLLADILAAVELEPGLLDARLSKFQRGLLACGMSPEHHEPGTPGTLSPDSLWLDVATAYLSIQLRQIKAYEPYAWEGVHPEGVHLMRVATRRARAGLKAFAAVLPKENAKQVRRGLSALTRMLGGVRDLDVHLQHLDAYRSHLQSGAHMALNDYQDHLEGLRDAARRRLLAALDDAGYRALLDDYHRLLNAAARAHDSAALRVRDAAQVMRGDLAQLHHDGDTIDETTPENHLHQLRISAKHLRYKLEILQPIYCGRLDNALTALRKLQDCLGLHQDACVARDHLADYRKHHAAGAAARKTLKKLMRLEQQRAGRQRRKFPKAWRRFEQAARELDAYLA
jgi:triphosphatase